MNCKKIFAGILCAVMLSANTVTATASSDNLLEYEPVTVAELESALFYDLKPLAHVYIDAGRLYGIDPVFLAAKDAEESGWGRYTAAPNNLGGWTSSKGYMSFISPESYIYYSASKMKHMYLEMDGVYYHGTSLSDVNVHYNGSQTWVDHVGGIMKDINRRINKYRSTVVL